MNDKLNFITNNMKSLRARVGMSQEDVANYLGISRTSYCDYEVNPSKVKVETFKKLSVLFKCNIADFFIEFNVTNSDTKENK